MTVVVTGASGHVGANLVRALIGQGRPVRCLVHVSSRAIDGLDVETARGDINDPASLDHAFRGADVVYHLAGRISLSMGGWPEIEAVNVNGVRNVVAACLRAGVRRLDPSLNPCFRERPLSVPVDESRSR
jgi:dihydroflavonol-4-reductase